MKRLKLLLTLNNSHISGIENFVMLVLKYIDRKEYEITVAVPFYGDLCKRLENIGVNYYIYNKNSKTYNLNGIFNTFKLMVSKRFDIVHANAGIIPCIFAKILGAKLIIEHRHGLDFSYEERYNIKGLRLFKEKMKKHFVQITLTGCESDRQYLIKKFEYKPESVYTLYNGIDGDSIAAGETVSKESFTVGTIGRLTYQKGQNYFIKMAKLINDESSSNNFRFEIWGEGEDREKLELQIKDLGLENKVFLMGYANNREIIYRSFDVFVLTSMYEGIPFVIIEAMRAKLPIISTEVGGINEVINDNYNGLLVQKCDSISLKDSVLKLYVNKTLANRLKENAFKDYKNLWGFEKTINKLEHIYKNYDT